jgi:hypothetical protein
MELMRNKIIIIYLNTMVSISLMNA